MKSEQKIYQQIEQSADLFQPSVYELLSFYHALSNEQDMLEGQFIPLTDVPLYGRDQTLLFAVGLIPPSTNITQKLLDRSASIRGINSNIDQDDLSLNSELPDVRQDNYLVVPNGGLVEKGSLSARFGQARTSVEGNPKQHQGIDIAAKEGAEVRAAADGVVIDISLDGQRAGYGNTIMVKHANGNISVYAHLNGYGPGISVGTQVVGGTVLGYVGHTRSPRDDSKMGNHLHFEVLEKGVYSDSGLVLNHGTDPNWVPQPTRLNPIPWLKEQGRSIASTKGDGLKYESGPITQDASTTKNWANNGSDNAQQASKTASQVANKDLNQTGLGKKFMAQQEAMINQMIDALTRMANTPPLRLLINPQSFRVSSEKIISDGNWGRNGPVIEHWGDNQDKIEGSGKVAAFYSIDALNGNGPGLTRTARQFSTSYQNLLSLWLLYKNNSGIYFDDPLVPAGSRAKNLSVVGSVYLYYDNILYIGSFDTFSLTEGETVPFSLEYSFSFTVRATFLLDHLDDPQYTYGRSVVPAVAATTSNTSPLMGGNNEQPSPNVALPPQVLSESELEKEFGKDEEFDIGTI